MWKKTLLALAAATAILGFAAPSHAVPLYAPTVHRHLSEPGPAVAEHVQYHPRRWDGGPRFGHRPPPGFGYDPMRHRRYDGPRHHWRGGGWAPPPGLYGGLRVYDDCRIIRKRVRVWTDYGWRMRWRTVRVCG